MRKIDIAGCHECAWCKDADGDGHLYCQFPQWMKDALDIHSKVRPLSEEVEAHRHMKSRPPNCPISVVGGIWFV